MRLASLLPAAGLMILASPAPATAPPAPTRPAIPAAEQAAIFRAAGFARTRGQWRGCDDPGSAGYTPGAIDLYRDVNGDGLPEAVVTEGRVLPPSSPAKRRAAGQTSKWAAPASASR